MTDHSPLRPPRRTPEERFTPLLRDYLQNRALRERAADIEGKEKDELMSILADFGRTEDKGHKVMELDDPLPLARKDKTVMIRGAKRTRRVSMSLDPEAATALLERLGLTQECTVMVPTLSEEAILAANFRGAISDDDLKSIYRESVSYAFNLIEE